MSAERFSGNPRDFAAKLRRLPKKLTAYRNEFLFETVAQTHAFLANTSVTPRDTGYLANGLGIDVAGAPPSAPQAPKRKDAAKDSYSGAEFDAMAMARALASGQPFVLGYQAEYAPYVEDRVHMMKRAKARMGAFQREALKVVAARAAGADR